MYAVIYTNLAALVIHLREFDLGKLDQGLLELPPAIRKCYYVITYGVRKQAAAEF